MHGVSRENARFAVNTAYFLSVNMNHGGWMMSRDGALDFTYIRLFDQMTISTNIMTVIKHYERGKRWLQKQRY